MSVATVRRFSRLMRQTVLVAPASAYDAQGEKTYGADVSYRCALVGEAKTVRTPHGEDVTSRQTAYLMSNAAIGTDDRVTLSTGDAGSTESFLISPPILSVGRYPFLRGQYFTQLWLG